MSNLILQQTMSSLELVAIINEMRGSGKAELRHDNFMAKIESHPGITSPKFLGHVDVPGPNGATRKSKCYHLPKREAELMVMSESLEVQTKVYDQFEALKAKVVARVQSTREKEELQLASDAAKAFPIFQRVARLIGCDKNAAAISANQAIIKLTGTNVLQLLESTHLPAEKQAVLWHTPTDLGKRIGVTARAFNMLLAEAGLQARRSDVWEITEAGKDFARTYDTGKRHGSGVPVTQIKWADAVLQVVRLQEIKHAEV